MAETEFKDFVESKKFLEPYQKLWRLVDNYMDS